MNTRLLEKLIRLMIEDDRNANVPNQLLTADALEDEFGDEERVYHDEQTDEESGIQEFSGVGSGAIAGYTAPLGIDPDRLGRKKNKISKK